MNTHFHLQGRPFTSLEYRHLVHLPLYFSCSRQKIQCDYREKMWATYLTLNVLNIFTEIYILFCSLFHYHSIAEFVLISLRMFLTDDISNGRLSTYILALNHYWKKSSIIRLLFLLCIFKYVLSQLVIWHNYEQELLVQFVILEIFIYIIVSNLI